MASAALSNPIQFRPLLVGTNLAWWKRINWQWVLQRSPMLAFAFVSSYGVGHLLALSNVPPPFDYLGAISFDLGYLGAIALADMQLRRNTWSQVAYYALNITMSGLAALFNVLSQAEGKYANIRLEHVTVGAPFALVGLAFALYFHSVMRTYIENELKEQSIQQAKQEALEEEERQRIREREEYERRYPFFCVCNRRFETNTGKRNHQRTCETYKKSNGV
jgi:signal transduction histidine kinase